MRQIYQIFKHVDFVLHCTVKFWREDSIGTYKIVATEFEYRPVRLQLQRSESHR